MTGLYYGDYLKLDAILHAQAPETAAHDEMLFIVVHQAYELWFRQILHEMDHVERLFAQAPLPGEDLSRIVASLARQHEIWKLLVGQITVLETMTPAGFLEFRDALFPASGFQSAQFRIIEARLGLAEGTRVALDEKAVEERLSEPDRVRLREARARPTLLAQLDAWLARTPFLDWGGTSFREAFSAAVRAMLEADAARLRADDALPEARREQDAAAIERAMESFRAVTEPEAAPGWRLSPRAVQAALFIELYRDQPAIALAHRLLQALMDLDETMALWRTRHALMVERMIGVRIGTGGSSGHAYLRKTAERHRVFADLFRLSTFLIPRAALPALPEDIRRRMGFVYAAG
jgi:tryptophan 2,3-dioxygenase